MEVNALSEHRYEGTWKLPDIEREQEGILFIDSEKGIIRLKLFVMGENGREFAHKLKTVCPIITGNLIGNNKITLVDNMVINRHEYLGAYTEVIAQVTWAFWGIHYLSKDEIKYNKYSVDMDGILNWCNLCKFDTDNLNDYKWVKSEKIKVKIKDNLLVNFIPVCKGEKGTAMIEKQLQLEQYIEIVFEYTKPIYLEEFIEDLKTLEMFITVGSGAIPLRRNLYYYDDRNKMFPEVSNIIKPREIYMGEKQYSDGYETHSINMLFGLNDIVSGNQLPISRWNEIEEKIKPAINLYFSIVKYDDMPIEMKYLNIVQALETYHARFKYNDLKKYKKHVLQLFRCKTIDDIDEKQRNAYFDVTQSDENITYIILKSRLVDLMNDDFRTPINPVYTNGKIIELYDFIEKVVDTRHYYTHYGKAKEEKSFKGIDMEYAIMVLMHIFEYHLLIELGLRNTGAVGKLYDRHRKLNYWYTQRCCKDDE